MSTALRFLRKLALIVVVVLTLTGLTTSAMTFASLAEGQTFLREWLPVWIRTALLIAPVGTAIMYLVEKTVNTVLGEGRIVQRKIATGLTMSLCMTSFMAVVTTMKLHGWTQAFFGQWCQAMFAGIPIALAISCLMVFVIKPRMDAVLSS